MGQEMVTLSGTPNFTPFGEFMISSHSLYIHYILLNLSVLGLCLWINDFGLFAWINLTALSRTYFLCYNCYSRPSKYSVGLNIFIGSNNKHNHYNVLPIHTIMHTCTY